MQTWIGGITNVVADRDGELIGFPAECLRASRPPRPRNLLSASLEQARRQGLLHAVFQPGGSGPSRGIPRLGCTGKSAACPRRIPAGSRRLAYAGRLRARNAVAEAGRRGESPITRRPSPYAYHIDQFEQLQEVWLKLYEYGTAMGLDMIQADHEDAPGMIEMNFQYDDALRTSDRLTTYRQLCAQVARECGLIAVFMSKPYMSLSGNGCHHNLSLWRGGAGLGPVDRPPGPAGDGRRLHVSHEAAPTRSRTRTTPGCHPSSGVTRWAACSRTSTRWSPSARPR